VLSHARALLTTGDGVIAVAADLRDPAGVLAHPELRAVIDPTRPVCVVLAAVLHFLDADAARAVTGGYARLMTPGSCLVISVARYDDEMLGKRLAAEYTAAGLSPVRRCDTNPPPVQRRTTDDLAPQVASSKGGRHDPACTTVGGSGSDRRRIGADGRRGGHRHDWREPYPRPRLPGRHRLERH
jgi:S-adenosyl methyltransferase